jgi:hypothetical protein
MIGAIAGDIIGSVHEGTRVKRPCGRTLDEPAATGFSYRRLAVQHVWLAINADVLCC